MSQITFKFPFKTHYYEKDFYVSSNNFDAYKLIENWPQWPGNNINIFGPSGSGKTHLANILNKKINTAFVNAPDVNNNFLSKIKKVDCVIIDDYQNNIQENLFYSLINEVLQSNQHMLINSKIPINRTTTNLRDLNSRFKNFISLGIQMPTDELLRVIITKSFSDKQIEVNVRVLEFILKNIDRSYEKIFKFIEDIDIASLSSGKSININLVKKVLKDE
ncbi:DnaA/Hda family protein [Pelagibacteraceae bacterium]|jgi:chromosomal replication initiation ATPase DnaA|nr:DnaA/Hda family protein [Pelagibacteraceae bacterium]|tara:strand:+ start:3216 stop:3872 length:657 start_codon:yes stop_codon:yes gene_type:complete